MMVTDVDTLIKNADLALHIARQNTKARMPIIFFESSLDEAARTRRQLEIDLRKGNYKWRFRA